jgi:uncharacterized circularly permuted ATP-grasp superfamily protein/uncharacterized alpha-E superfamily protein
MSSAAGPEAAPAPSRWVAEYRPGLDGYDEFKAPLGFVRPHWTPLVRPLEALGAAGFAARRETARRLLREHGVTYNVYGDEQGLERPWELDLMPLLVAPSEWARLEAGLIQRSYLLNAVLDDLYGAQRLLRDGLLPPSLVHSNPAFLRPCHGLRPPGGRFLFLHAVDLARTPDGRWWVVADRTQAPSGTGYALENRIILSRTLPDEFEACQVRRLAGFFGAARDYLRQLAPAAGGAPNVVLLTPGPYNETYFEHAYLARYLGFPLVEGGDLTVRDRRVFIKTLEGLRPVDVILRRVDDTFCDPLELRPDSMLGVPGLLEAARAGHVVVANALGAGVLETPALLAFLPALAQRLLGEELALPNAATWWCGQKPELAHTLAHLDGLVLKRAFRGRGAPVLPEELGARQLAELRREIERQPHEFVGQERLTLSTAPVWAGDRLEARPVVLRAYVAATAEGYRVMPGGLTRFSRAADEPIVSTQRGGGSKDTWVLSDGPVEKTTLLAPPATGVKRDRAPAEVPSRTADNLFWLGRYAERLEHHVRLLRALFNRLGGESSHDGATELATLVQALVWLGLLPDRFGQDAPAEELEEALLQLVDQPQRQGSLRDLLGRLRYLTASVRDRLSNDTWRIFQRMQYDGLPATPELALGDVPPLLNTLIVDLAAFSGMELENMTRGHAWRFLELGRRLERGQNLLALVRAALAAGGPAPATLAPLLEIADSVMTHRRRYFEHVRLATVLDLLLADEKNPRSLAFQLEAMLEHLEFLPLEGEAAQETPEEIELLTVADLLGNLDLGTLAAAEAEPDLTALDHLLGRMTQGLGVISDRLTQRYFSHALTRAS